MIEGVNASRGATGADTGRAAAGAAPGSVPDFGAVMSAASAAEERMERVRREVRPPRGERWEVVPGRADYADVVSGPRNGHFVNLQEGPRQGEVFHRIRNDGREFHVYGEGRDRKTIEVKPRDRDPADVRPREGETFEAVQGHRDYKQIDGGDRDDLFINTSGNDRTGRAFSIDERDGQRFHVYGTGENALEIRVGWRDDAQKREDGDAQERADD
ncbi:MAG: hypothetical protein WD844_15715 [Thermoleophilaceae bacterium]